MKDRFIIAVDGYSSCGKSTLAKAVAKELGIVYVDSGAMYRCVALHFLDYKVNIDDPEQLISVLQNMQIAFSSSEASNKVLLNGTDVTDDIRTMRVASYVSKVSSLVVVRSALVKQQQGLGKQVDLIMDGRDIGSVVFPRASLKLFMTADPAVRAERRWRELLEKDPDITLKEISENLSARDYLDTTRTESPLARTDDAIVIDNTCLTPDEQLKLVLGYVKERKNHF